MEKTYTRRNFLTKTSIGFAGYSLLFNVPLRSEAEIKKDFDYQELNRKIKEDNYSQTLQYNVNEPTMKQIEIDCDVFVAGGGMAGICAAISAARNGMKVLFCHNRSVLGGNASSEVRMHILGVKPYITGFKEGGILEEILLENAYRNPQASYGMWSAILYDKIVSEKNITLLLDTSVYAVDMESQNKIKTAYARCDISWTIYKVNAKYFIDTTGDGKIAKISNDDMMYGREPSTKFGESSYADYDQPNTTMGSSMLFFGVKYNKQTRFVAPKWARKIDKSMLVNKRAVNGVSYGYTWIELGGDRDIILDNELLRFELMAIIMGIWDYAKNSGELKGLGAWGIDYFSVIPARRESFRITPENIFTENDLKKNWKNFKDSVCVGGWPLDDHPKGGFNDFKRGTSIMDRSAPCYNIGFGSLFSKKIQNLFMAGRNAGVSHVALCSTRIMATCAVMGQAVGTASAFCVKENKKPTQVRANQTLMDKLQQLLLRDDQTIVGVKNNDAEDIALTAKATSSDSILNTKAENVLNGYAFELKKDIDKQPLPEKTLLYEKANRPIENRWMAPLKKGLNLELSWDSPQKINQLQITFDGGADLLCLSGSNMKYRIKYDPPKELVKDFKVIAILPNEKEKELAYIKDNYQKLVRIDFPTENLIKIKLEFLSTHGDENVSVFELRAYKH